MTKCNENTPVPKSSNSKANEQKTRNSCATCSSKINKHKFCCVYCQKTLCLKPECTGFDKSCIDVLIKYEKNLLHICNECTGKKGNTTLKMESTDNTALNDQLKELHEKISNFAYSIEQTNISLDNMQKEIKSLKNPNEYYASVVGANNAGKVVYKPQTFNQKTLGIRIRGMNESKSKEAADRMQEDLCHVEQILEHLNIEDRKITKLVKLGKFNSENKRERVIILVHTASELSRDLILKSVSRLKDYKYNDRSIYISPELPPVDAKKKKTKLQLKGEN